MDPRSSKMGMDTICIDVALMQATTLFYHGAQRRALMRLKNGVFGGNVSSLRLEVATFLNEINGFSCQIWTGIEESSLLRVSHKLKFFHRIKVTNEPYLLRILSCTQAANLPEEESNYQFSFSHPIFWLPFLKMLTELDLKSLWKELDDFDVEIETESTLLQEVWLKIAELKEKNERESIE